MPGDITLTTAGPRAASLSVQQADPAARGDVFVELFDDQFGHPGGGQIAADLRGRPLASGHFIGSPTTAVDLAGHPLTLTGPRS